jgi:hypothetical protein
VQNYLKVVGRALSRSVITRSSKRDARILSDSCSSSSSSSSGDLSLTLLRTQLRIELLVSLNGLRLLSTRALIIGCRIIALTADFAVGVYKRHSEIA